MHNVDSNNLQTLTEPILIQESSINMRFNELK